MKTNRGYSLNNFLLTGPNRLPELIDLVATLRVYPFVFAADIEKMFRQIWVHPEDQHLQVVVWRDDPGEELATFFSYYGNFGFNCSLFLAIRTLRQLATDEGKKFPLAAEVIAKEVYMDDFLTGEFTLEATKAKQKEAIDLLARGGFKLRKWIANNSYLFDWIDRELIACEDSIQLHSGFNVLGLNWNPTSDCFFFQTYA